jgi:antitoxin CcdA
MASKQRVQPAEVLETGEVRHDVNAVPELSEAAKRWITENAEAIRSSNDYVEKHGLPLAKYRMF